MQLFTPHDVGSLIRARRLAVRMTQSELAHRLGVSRLWISQAERGNPGASLGAILRALTELGVGLITSENEAIDASDEAPSPPRPDIDAILAAARRR